MLSTIVAIAFLLPATAACLYYGVLILAGLGSRSAPVPESGRRYAVLVPAHNEACSLPATLRSLAAADIPRDRLNVVVVADNCTDDTAAIGRVAGVTVLERHHATDRGKGYALRFGLEAIVPSRPDAVVILDADCQVEPRLFRVLDARLARGAEALQVAVVTRNADDGPTGFLGAVGNAFDNGLSAGKDRLGLPVPLRGSGMCFRREILERFPWSEFGLTEDADYAERLRRGGVRVRFESEPLVRSETPARRADLYGQRRRWRAALFGGPGFCIQWVESKPLVLAQLAATGSVIAGAGGPFALWYATVLVLTAAIYATMIARVGVTRRRLGFLLAAPGIVARLAWVAIGGFVSRDRAWERTRRAAEPI